MTLFSRLAIGFVVVALSGTADSAWAAKKKKKKPVEKSVVTDLLPAPLEGVPAELREDMGRRRGQTSFVNVKQNLFFGMARAQSKSGGEEGAVLESASADGAKREQQESDVYKIGPKDSKLLYVLNSYRGLQAISFKNGADKPALVGRVKATGNWSDNMYVDHRNSRIVVLERDYYDGQTGEYTRNQSRMVVYDIADPTKPKLAGMLPIEGEIADSRIVGDVLYVATSVRPDPNFYGGSQGAKHEGKVFSFSLREKEITPVDQATLALPTSMRENMGIVEVSEGGKYKYYLTAVLSQDGWGWWDRNSWVEVVDISSPDGKIRPVMTVGAKGFIERRQQVHVKDGTLIVTSNYFTDEDGKINRWNGTARVAVETFGMPRKNDLILTQQEADYWRVHIEKNTFYLKGADRERIYEEIVFRERLRTAFVSDENGKLKKLLADSTVTFGDTTGQSASLRDVRYVGDRLYAFWVPANMVDPFDLLDISKPREGVKYLKRLTFDGWIEKAVPIPFGGKEYVLGLGRIVPNLNNDNGRRHIQAMLFEIAEVSGQLRPLDVAQITLGGDDMWANLNDQDKFIEVRVGADGKGSVMFPVQFYSKDRYGSGGKLIGFDLAAAVAGKADQVFREGGLISGGHDWLKRVFSNPEIDKFNTFSDKTLGTFEVNPAALGDAKTVYAAMSVLELARDVRGYSLLGDGRDVFGVQIVAEGSGNTWAGEEGRTGLRLVKPVEADAERTGVLNERVLEGTYTAHRLTADGRNLLVATTEYVYPKRDAVGASMKMLHRVYRMGMEKGALKTVAMTSWEDTEVTAADAGAVTIGSQLPNLTPVSENTFLISGGSYYRQGKARLVTVDGGSLLMADLETPAQALGSPASLIQLGGKFYLTYEQSVGKPVEGTVKPQTPASERARIMRPWPSEIEFVRHFAVPAQISADGKLTLGKPINIPGRPVAVFGGNHLVTEDVRLMDLTTEQHPHVGDRQTAVTEKYLVSLRIDWVKATLMDLYRSSDLSAETLKTTEAGFVYVDSQGSQESHGPIMPFHRGGRFGMMPPRHWNRVSAPRLAGLSFDANLFFSRDLRAIRGVELGANASLSFIEKHPAVAGAFIGMISDGRNAQIVTWNEKDLVPVVVPVRVSDERMIPGEPVTKFALPPGGYWMYNGENGGIHFNAGNRSLEIPAGLTGVCQIWLTEGAAPAKLK